MAESIGGQASITDVDDDYLRWQEEIRFAEEEAEALKADNTHECHKVSQGSTNLPSLITIPDIDINTRPGELALTL